MTTLITQSRRPARIVASGGRLELKAGRRGLGRLVGQASDTAEGLDTLRELASRAGLYVWAVQREESAWTGPRQS